VLISKAVRRLAFIVATITLKNYLPTLLQTSPCNRDAGMDGLHLGFPIPFI
jgi:hypothetical protein